MKFLNRRHGGRQSAKPFKFLCFYVCLLFNFRSFTVINLSLGVLSTQQDLIFLISKDERDVMLFEINNLSLFDGVRF